MVFEVKEVSTTIFLEMYVSGIKVEKEAYMSDLHILRIDDCYLVSPGNYSDYMKFIIKIEIESPLLAELR